VLTSVGGADWSKFATRSGCSASFQRDRETATIGEGRSRRLGIAHGKALDLPVGTRLASARANRTPLSVRWGDEAKARSARLGEPEQSQVLTLAC
jgi:hypothetical protein